jgi:hypothetical protein
LLLGNAGLFQEVNVTWQLFRLAYALRAELMWNGLQMTPDETF